MSEMNLPVFPVVSKLISWSQNIEISKQCCSNHYLPTSRNLVDKFGYSWLKLRRNRWGYIVQWTLLRSPPGGRLETAASGRSRTNVPKVGPLLYLCASVVCKYNLHGLAPRANSLALPSRFLGQSWRLLMFTTAAL